MVLFYRMKGYQIPSPHPPQNDLNSSLDEFISKPFPTAARFLIDTPTS